MRFTERSGVSCRTRQWGGEVGIAKAVFGKEDIQSFGHVRDVTNVPVHSSRGTSMATEELS
jgi:hypothetical protein